MTLTASVSNWPDRRCTARWSSWRMSQWCGPPQWGKAGYHTSSSHRPSPNTLFHCPWLTRAKRLKSCRQRQSRISFLPNLSINASEEFIFISFSLEMSRSVKRVTMSICCPCAALCTWLCSRSAWGSSWWQTGSHRYIMITTLNTIREHRFILIHRECKLYSSLTLNSDRILLLPGEGTESTHRTTLLFKIYYVKKEISLIKYEKFRFENTFVIYKTLF